MPLMRCTREGKKGWKWGAEGFCFTSEDAEQKARDQGLAVMRSMARKAGQDPEEYMRTRSSELEKE
jgi:hypothetical protein